MVNPKKELRGINHNKDVQTCLAFILQTKLNVMLSLLEKVKTNEDSEVLHKMRVSGRRLETVFKIYRRYFPKKEFKIHYQMLRKLLQSSGRVREYDIFISFLEEKITDASGIERTAMDLFIARKRKERQEARKKFMETLKEFRRQKFGVTFVQLVKHLV